jgi:hypothetical protein
MAQTEFYCESCKKDWFDNKMYEHCPFCGEGHISWWVDEDFSEEVEVEL